ncbi:MAG: hydroxyethylthiazole kinase [Pseudonocardiales bacterium]|nr:hydroxyethylthiazole kinase [Jatrophihabitantaceae bacterium]MCW2602268.1 hydroxyethylthiazole kinase [Pseudonocardiales bacterium]
MTSSPARTASESRPPITPQAAAQVLRDVRASAPLVQCLTNIVVANFTANVLLAAGAAPAMVDSPEEAGILAGVASAVLINLGTLTTAQEAGMRVAVAAADDAGVPWVLDPVAIGALPMRTKLAGDLAEQRPRVIRGNASEIAAIVGGMGGRGVDSTATPDDAAGAAAEVARRFGTVAAVSGALDLLTDGRRTVRIAAGNALLTKVTGVGCSLGALIAACSAVTDDALLASAAATSLVCVAGDVAAARTVGLGSFAVALLDAISTLDADAAAAAVVGA